MADQAAPEPMQPGDQLENSLWKSEEHFRHLVAGVEDYAIFLLDPGGHVGSWNLGAERIKGYTAEEILGRHFSIFYGPAELARGLPDLALRTAAREGRFTDEGWRLRKDGSRFWAGVSISALRGDDSRLAGFLKITRDMTERKRAEDTLRESEQRFRLLVESVQDYAIFLLSPEGHVVSWNVGAARIKGYTPQEIIGKHFSCFYPPEAVAQGRPAWELRVAREHGRVEDEGWRIRKDGRPFWANVVLTALIDKEGTLRGFAKVTRDMTERRKIEALQEADRQKNEFLALMAHELRNPLGPIRNALYILAEPGANAVAAARAREMAQRQVQHMTRLLDDLLDLARVTTGKVELHREVIRVEAVIDAAVETVRPLIERRGHRLTVTLPPGLPGVDGDPARLEQVLIHLLDNAARYTAAGGQIWVSGEQEGAELVLRVRDTGIGIDPVLVPRVFDLFVQAERQTDRSVGGLGIGLSLVKRLVELHGGTVQAFSAGRGTGSEFVVRLPGVEIPHGGESGPEDARGSADLAVLRILVVDDNVDEADSLAMLLRLTGQEVEVAYDGRAALALAPTFRPHAVLLDLGMPGMDGYEVAQALRRLPETQRAMLVAITGWGQQEDRRGTKEAGFDHHVTKPADPALVQRLLAEFGGAGRR